MKQETPYEFFDGHLGIQARYIFSGVGSHSRSLQLISDRGLRKRIDTNSIQRLRKNAPGQTMLLRFDTLPITWQELSIKTFGDPPKEVKKSLFERTYRRDSSAFDFFSAFRFSDNTPLDDDKIEEYTLNASVLNTIIELYDKRRTHIKSLKGSTESAWAATCNDAARFKEIENHTLPSHPTNLRTILNKYKKESYQGIIRKTHRNSNARKVTPEVELFLDALFADYRNKPNKYEVAKQYEGFLSGYIQVVNNETGEIYSPSDFPHLSLSTVRSYISKWRNAIATEKIRSGDRQIYMGKFKPYHTLEQPKFAGSIISIDDRQPPFEYADKKRMWFYNGIDLGSEAFVCWVYGKSKEGIILDFYRQLVRNYAHWGLNLPAELECEMSLNSSFKESFLKEGNMFQYVRIEANNARGKRIEAYYRQLRYKHEKKREGWLARPFARDESNQASPIEVKPLPYEKIVQGCLQDIENWNNTEHSKIKGKSRWEVFMEMQNPDLRPTNYRGIIPYLGYETKTSCNAGQIKVNNTLTLLGHDGILAVGSSLISLMDQVEGRDITVRWLDDLQGNILKAYIYVGDAYVCEAVPKPIYNRARIERTAADETNYQLMSSYVATIEAYGRRRVGEIDKFTIIDNTPERTNKTFRISNLSHYVPREEMADELPDLNGFETGFNTSLMDRGQRSASSLKERF